MADYTQQFTPRFDALIKYPLTGIQLKVLAVMLQDARLATGGQYEGMLSTSTLQTIADSSGITHRQNASRAIEGLKRQGWIEQLTSDTVDGNTYRLNMNRFCKVIA